MCVCVNVHVMPCATCPPLTVCCVRSLPRPQRGCGRVRDALRRWAHGARQSACRKLAATLRMNRELAKKEADEAERKTNGLHDPRYVRAAAADYIGQFIKCILV